MSVKPHKKRARAGGTAASEALRLSVVMPALNEAGAIVKALRSAAGADQIVVADGGSTDATAALARSQGATVISAPRGRASQMNAGAAMADGEVVLFLHADTHLPAGFADQVRELIEVQGCGWGRFDLRFDRRTFLLDRIAWLISTRSRISGGATGDQAIFMRRDIFEALGGYQELPLFEDVEICRRLKRGYKMGIPDSPVTTSARRWHTDGAIRVSLLMWTLKGLYLCGVSPHKLAAFYRQVR